MVTKICTGDGTQYKDWDLVTNTALTPGGWIDSGVTNGALIGFFKISRNVGSFLFDTIAISAGASVASATLNLYVRDAANNVQFIVKHYADADTPQPSPSFLPESQALGSAFTYYNSVVDANVSDGSWTPAAQPIAIDVKAHLQELVNSASWASGKKAVFVVIPEPYVAEVGSNGNDGLFTVHPRVSAVGAVTYPAELVYTLTTAPTITSVGGDDIILADESNVIIAGTDLTGASGLRIYKGANSYPQTISTNTATAIQFNAAGNIPTDTGYTLEVTIDTATVTRTVQIVNEVIVIENATEGSALTSVDGHEYVVTAAGFPGTWETKSSVASTVYFTDSIIIGRWEGNDFKSSIKLGPILADNSAIILSAELNLNVVNNWKFNDLRISAVADPDAAEIGAANVISSQTLTTAVSSVDTADWANANDTGNWIQAVNPKNLDITAVFQEVINHANWSSGDYIQIVIDFVEYPFLQGVTRIGTNDESATNASTITFVIDNGTTITSISSDDVIELGELGCTIVGLNLGSASNLIISKGAISEAQTITSNTATNIVFDITTGAIVVDTGYTVSFDIGGDTFTHTVEFVAGGGVNTGSSDPTLDGYEDTVAGAWYDEYVTQNVNIIGYSPYLPAQLCTAVAKIGPIAAQRGQTITTGDLTWACAWVQGAFKQFDFRVYAVANPSAADVATGNLPSAQALTTAYLDVDTSTWTGVDPFSYWQPGAEVLDISAVVEEVVGNANWSTGSYVQLVFQPQAYPSGNAGISFNSTESGSTLLSFDYVTAAATNIASINGNNEIHVNDTTIALVGNDLGSATALSITDGTYTTVQTIDTNTSTLIEFDFVQGSLGYTTGATLTVTIGGIGYDFSCTLLPAVGRSYVVVSTAGTGDNSLTYNEAPALSDGDLIDYLSVSTNGFTVSVSAAGIPTISGGLSEDTLTARGYIASTGTWYDLQTITFLQASYFVRNDVPLLEFSSTIGAGVVISSGDFTNTPDPEPGEPPLQDVSETWTVQNDTDDTESWT